ncbi:MAG: DUF1440 domain-containing protein [Chloroflexi bacterium]|nr:DUF1440 domain-containing protein [Chloroflexota bacterium]
MSTRTMQSPNAALSRQLVRGAAAGLVGGVAFGILMTIWGVLPMVGMLVGQENAVVGFVVHLLISAFIGATFGVIAARLPSTWVLQIGAGAVYGVIWWVLGALVLMPLLLGMNEMVLQIGAMQVNSLIGHLVFGVLTGVAYKVLSERR